MKVISNCRAATISRYTVSSLAFFNRLEGASPWKGVATRSKENEKKKGKKGKGKESWRTLPFSVLTDNRAKIYNVVGSAAFCDSFRERGRRVIANYGLIYSALAGILAVRAVFVRKLQSGRQPGSENRVGCSRAKNTVARLAFNNLQSGRREDAYTERPCFNCFLSVNVLRNGISTTCSDG